MLLPSWQDVIPQHEKNVLEWAVALNAASSFFRTPTGVVAAALLASHVDLTFIDCTQ